MCAYRTIYEVGARTLAIPCCLDLRQRINRDNVKVLVRLKEVRIAVNNGIITTNINKKPRETLRIDESEKFAEN